MKKFFLTILLIMFYVAGYCQSFSKETLIGTWEGTDEAAQTGIFNFVDSSKLAMISPDNDTLHAIYKTGIAKDALLIDIIDTRGVTPKTLEGVIRFLNQNTITMELFFDEKRPAILPDANPGNTMTFKRVIQTK